MAAISLAEIRKNLFAELLLPLKKRPEYDAQTIPVYCYHYKGIEESSAYKNRITNFANQCGSRNIPLLIFNDALGLAIPDAGFVARLKGIPEAEFSPESLALLLTESLWTSNSPMPKETYLRGFSTVFKHYSDQKPNRSQTINFVSKLKSWLTQIHDRDNSDPNADFNAKILYYGELKEHEGLFLLSMAYLGWDIVYLNPEKKTPPKTFAAQAHEKEEAKSENLPFFLGEFSAKTASQQRPIPDLSGRTSQRKSTAQRVAPPPQEISSAASPKKSYPKPDLDRKDRLFAVKKEAQDPVADLLKPWGRRSEYSVKDAVVVSVYCCSIVGCEEDQKHFENKLLAFYSERNKRPEFLKVEGNLPMDGSEEDIRFIKALNSDLGNTEPSSWPGCIAQSQILKSFPDFLHATLLRELSALINGEINDNLNLQSVKNLLTKILLWLLTCGCPLFASLTKEASSRSSPCLLFFGNPKKHELLFLLFMNRIGCDILHINPEKPLDYPELADGFQIFDCGNYVAMEKFPDKEHIVRQETAARRASREIDQVMHSADSGFYRPWQLQNSKTAPLGLKTTFDEVKILWREEALVRPGFKVTNERVYLPNIFVKISGVPSKMSAYLDDGRFFIDTPLTYVFPELPLIAQKIKQGNVFVVSNLFDREGNLRPAELRKHPLYSFTHLPSSLQDLFVRKVTQFFETPLLLEVNNLELRKKIVITLLSMDSEILNLWQQYDYPRRIPKIVVFDSKQITFALEDAILTCFLYLLGFDILILTPTGYDNLEGFVNREYFDVHRLEALNFEVTFDKLKRKPSNFFTDFFRNR